jgi:hypothetical protein
MLFRVPLAREDVSYWGILGIGLLWIVPWVAAYGLPNLPGARFFALATIVYFLTVAYTGVYDPWRGRFFIPMAMFALPAVAGALEQWQGAPFRIYIFVLTILACGSGAYAVIFRDDNAAGPQPRSLAAALHLDRTSQLLRDRPEYIDALRAYESIVPPDATVGVSGVHAAEYVLFGEGMTRTLIPLVAENDRLPPTPDGVDFIVYSRDVVTPEPDDVHLGIDMYLRCRQAQIR